MSSTFRRGVAALNAEADAVGRLLDDGYLTLYTGTQPQSPAHAADGITLATVRFRTPAFTAATEGIARAVSMLSCVAVSTGSPTWFRATQADGVPVYDGSVGVEADAPDLTLDHLPVQVKARVSIGLLRYRAVAT
jgi:hypothetical protein